MFHIAGVLVQAAFLPVALLLAAVSSLLAPGELRASQDTPPDLILYNGKVVTMDPRLGTVEALAIAGERVAAAGSTADVLRLAGPESRTIDLQGRTVIPGLGDNHYHGIGGGRGVDLSRVRSLDELLAKIAERAAVTPAGELIVTNSDWHEGQLREQRLPLRDDLDRAAPNHPVVVVRGGHEYVLNSAALRMWQITEKTPEPPGGKIGRYPDGRLNGELVDRARGLVELPPRESRTLEETIADLREEYRKLNLVGITSIRYPGAAPELYAALKEMRKRNLLTVRVTVLFRLPASVTPPALDSVLSRWAVAPGEGDEWLKVGGIKLGVDGGFEGGWMRRPYNEPWGNGGNYYGLSTVDPDRYREIVRSLNLRGWRVATHAVGDAAIDLVLDAYESADAVSSIRERRWSIEHAFVVAPDQLDRMKRLGVLLSVQNHLYVAAPSLVRYWGAERAGRVTPVRTYLDAGLHVSSGTDSPVIPYNPWWTMYHFVTRRTISAGVMGFEERVGRMEALKLATVENAYLAAAEKERGTLAPGMLADLAVLSRDFLTCDDSEIESIGSVLTIVGGKIVASSNQVR
ncbi:MAG: amidohydrolase [Gemmatimonadales bacterium]|nr:N-substituted formamide deformylase [bacterium HR33]GIW51474.1 MAG: amidohydrolase [Gemmatimonadales bacterium]